MGDQAVVGEEKALVIGQLREHTNSIAVRNKQVSGMGGKAGAAPHIIGLYMLPVATAHINTIAVVGEVLAQEGVTHHDVTACLQVAIVADSIPDHFQPPSAVLITGFIPVGIAQIVAGFKSIAPKIVLHTLETVLPAQGIDSGFHILPDIGAAHVQNTEATISETAGILQKPVIGFLVNKQLLIPGDLQSNPKGGTQTNLTDAVSQMPQTVGELLLVDTGRALVRNADAAGIFLMGMVAVIQLNPAHSGEVFF